MKKFWLVGMMEFIIQLQNDISLYLMIRKYRSQMFDFLWIFFFVISGYVII